MRIVLLVIALVLLIHLIWWWWADRLLKRLPRGETWRTALGVYMVAMLGYVGWMFVQPDAARAAHLWLPAWLLGWVYLWYIFAVPAAVLGLMIYGLVRLANRVVRRDEPPRVDDPATDPQLISRRQVLTGITAAAPIIITAGSLGVGMRQIRHFRIRRIELTLPQLPPALDGMSIAHLSDSHVGRYTRGPILRRIAEATNELSADFVAVTGDLIDLSLQDLPDAIRMLQRIDPRRGMLICEGNHDLIDDGNDFRRAMLNSGFDLLLNESRTIEFRGRRVQFLGVNWARGEEARSGELARLVPLIDRDAFPILLTHHPHVFDDAAALGIPLTLAGHTHGGQIMLGGHVGAGRALFRYLSGHYRKLDSSLIVSNGVGNWFPLRTNAPAEIIHLVLRS